MGSTKGKDILLKFKLKQMIDMGYYQNNGGNNITKTHLYSVNAKTLKGNVALINIKLKIVDIEDLKELQKKIKKLDWNNRSL